MRIATKLIAGNCILIGLTALVLAYQVVLHRRQPETLAYNLAD